MGVIYLRTNLINGMQYIGQAKNFKKRETNWNCLKLKYANQLLNDEREKYGLANFKTEILKECDDEDLNKWERHYIVLYDTIYPNGYNDNEGGTIGFKHSERTKGKISEANSGENNGMYGKDPWNKGIKNCFSEEAIQKSSKSHMGNTSALGHKVSEETKKQISNTKTGVPNIALSKPVEQIDMKTGDIVKIWNSAAEAGRNGFKSISRVCRGERPHAYGYFWKYHKKG